MTDLVFRTSKDEDTVKRYLTNADLFVSAHPLIYKMERTGENRYRVFEKINTWFFPYRFTYDALITHDANEVEIKATVLGMTTILMAFVISKDGNSTVVKESICVKSPLPIKNYIHSLFKKQHGIFFRNMERL